MKNKSILKLHQFKWAKHFHTNLEHLFLFNMPDSFKSAPKAIVDEFQTARRVCVKSGASDEPESFFDLVLYIKMYYVSAV
jgi:hypothetical protein